MIDRSLNYGRHLIQNFSQKALLAGPDVAKVLDIGAGSGSDLALVQSVAPKAELHGVEIFSQNVALLKGLGVTTHALNLELDPLPFENESLDLVIANQVLEHTKEIFWIFHQVSRSLKVGGSFLIGVPNLASFHSRCLLAVGRQPTAIQTASAHIRGFTQHDLLRFIEKCFPGGYQMTQFGGSNFYPFPAVIAKPLAQVWGNGSVSIFLLLKKIKPYENSFINFPVQEKLETNYYLGEPATKELR